MTQNEAHNYLLRVIEDAVMRLGSKANLAREFDLKPAAISQWINRQKFPGRYAYRICKIVEPLHDLAKIHDAFFVLKHPEQRGDQHEERSGA